jgi:two-component system response regulator ChvI
VRRHCDRSRRHHPRLEASEHLGHRPADPAAPARRQLAGRVPDRHTPTSHERLAFDRGAIDFIDKARGVEVLVRRLKRVVEGAKPAAALPPDKRMVFGKLVLRPTVSRAYWNEADVGLTVGEYNIVQLLASNVGRHVSYRAIYDRVHYEGFIAGSGDHGYRSNVRSVIKRIRNKFRALDPTFTEIENYQSFGYCWGQPED